MKIFISILLFFILTSCRSKTNSGGTTVLLIIDSDSSWIVADSRRTVTDERTNKILEYETVCKIGLTKTIFYTFASPYVSEDMGGYILFDAYDEMKKAIEQSNSLDSAYIIFDKKISEHLTKICRADSVKNSSTFAKKDGTYSLFQAAVITYINSKPVYKLREYYNKKQVEGKIEIASHNLTDQDSLPIELFLGHSGEITDFLQKNQPYYFHVNDIKSWGAFLIKIEAKATNDVDSIVNIISIGNDNGYNWILKNQPCN